MDLLSNECGKVILIHYDVLFDEWGFSSLKFLRWKKGRKRYIENFTHNLTFSTINFSILCPAYLEEQVDKLIREFPFRMCHTYESIFDIKRLGLRREQMGVIEYYDDNGERGCLFGTAWKAPQEIM